MKPFLITGRIARRLARKLAKPAALWRIERQLRGSRSRATTVTRGAAAQLQRQHQVQLIGRRNLIRGW